MSVSPSTRMQSVLSVGLQTRTQTHRRTHLGGFFGFWALCGWLDSGFLPNCCLVVKETATRRRERDHFLLSAGLNRWKDLVCAQSIVALTHTNTHTLSKVSPHLLTVFLLTDCECTSLSSENLGRQGVKKQSKKNKKRENPPFLLSRVSFRTMITR